MNDFNSSSNQERGYLIDDEVSEIYQYLINNLIKPSKFSLSINRIQRYLLKIAVILFFSALVLLIAILSTSSNRNESLIPVFLFLLFFCLVTIVTFQIFSIVAFVKKDFANPTENFLKALKNCHIKEINLINGLQKFDSSSLTKLAERLSLENERLSNLAGLLIETLDKVGIVPAIATLYFAYTKYSQGSSQQARGEYILVTFVIGLYIGAIYTHIIAISMRELSRIILDAAEYSRKEKPVYKWSIEDYHQILESRVLDDKFVEFIEGNIIIMSPEKPIHSSRLDAVSEYLRNILPRIAKVRKARPITLDESEPEPDIAIVKYQNNNYRDRHPSAQDIYWLIEVSNRTLTRDLEEKSVIYARNGIPEYWVIDLPHEKFWIFTKPQKDGYENKLEVTTGIVYPLSFPSLDIRVNELLNTYN